MSDTRNSRRAEVEIDSDVALSGCAGIGNRSIHQFWHLFAAHFRGILLAPRRRPDSGKVVWSWRESPDSKPLTVIELADVRRRLANASRSLTGGLPGQTLGEANPDDSDAQSLEAQVRVRVERMIANLVAKSDQALAGYVCRAEAGTMLHSWGAATPAQPIFPDSQHGEISGMVLMNGVGAAGLSVVLEKLSGETNARMKSDRTGAFRFQAIAPGNYRLRVADRTDFPAAGLTIQMERSALTGLELRGGSADPAVASAKADRLPPRSRRWLVRGLVALVLLIAGFGLWRYTQRTVVKSAKTQEASGWQSAKGQLAAAPGDTTPAEVRLAGGAGGWTELSRNLPDPKRPAIRQIRRQPVETGIAAEHRPLSESSPLVNEIRERAEQPVNPAASAMLKPAQSDLTPADQAGPVPPVQPADRSSAESSSDAQTGVEETVPAVVDKNSPDPTREEQATKRPSTLGESLPVAYSSDSKADAPGATLHSSTTSSTAKSPTSAKAVRGTSASSRNGAASMNTASGMDAAPASGLPASVGSSLLAMATDHVAASPGAHQREQTGATNQGKATIESFLNNTTADRVPETAEVASEPAAAKVAPQSHRAAENKTKPVETGPTSAAKTMTPASAAGKDDASKNPAAPAQQTPVEPVPGTGEAMSDGAVSQSVDEATGPKELVRQGRIRATAWALRLLQDAIVPTLPMSTGQSETVENLREKLVEAQRARLPQTFREPVTQCGFAVEFEPAGAGELSLPRWRDATGAEPAEAMVQAHRAELLWTGQSPLRGQEYILSYPDGREIARVSVEEGGAPVLKAAKNVSGWYWVGIEHAAVDEAGRTAAAGRFSWRLLSGEPIPSSWRRDDHWREGRGQRLDLPLNSGGKPERNYPLALVDRLTGWALTSEIGAP